MRAQPQVEAVAEAEAEAAVATGPAAACLLRRLARTKGSRLLRVAEAMKRAGGRNIAPRECRGYFIQVPAGVRRAEVNAPINHAK